MDFNPEKMRARFAELRKELEKRQAKLAPLREKRDRLLAKQSEAGKLAVRIKEQQAPLAAIEEEMAVIARALNGKTG